VVRSRDMRGSRVGTTKLVVLAIAIGLSSSAAAKVSVQGFAGASAGWTDNILNVPSLTMNSPATAVGPEADWFFDLRPGLALTTGVPRAIQRLAYTFDATLFASHNEANSYQNRVDWAGFFLPTKTMELFINASLTQGRLNTFNLTQPTGAVAMGVVPAGGTTYVGSSLMELLSWEFEPNWRFVESLAFNSYAPIDPKLSPDTFEVDTHFAVERGLRHDAFALDLRLDYSMFTAVHGPVSDPTFPTGLNPNGVIAPGLQQVITVLVGKWRHDFGRFWNLELDLGGLAVVPANGSGSPIWQPAGLAAIRYQHLYAAGELIYAHTASPNLLVGEIFAIDSVSLHAAVPFGIKSHLTLAASGGYQRGSILAFESINGAATGTVAVSDLFLADATLTWTPRHEVSAYLRYSYVDQIGSGNPNPSLEPPTFARNTIMLGVMGTYPGEAAAVVPSRQALRVDRADAIGAPEPHSDPQPAR
jgi:hypothetical protein